MTDYSEILNIIVAAGSGSRFGGELPKQFCLLDGVPVLLHSIRRLEQALPGSMTVVVLHKDFVQYWRDTCKAFSVGSQHIVTGGATRWESVRNALEATRGLIAGERIITVHDGARPLVTSTVITNVINACLNSAGAIPAVEVTDSLRQIDNTGQSHAVDRATFRAVQTPQAFRADALRQAYTLPYSPEFTDDASVMTSAGHTDIALVDGDSRNIKITHPQDLAIAAIYLRDMK